MMKDFFNQRLKKHQKQMLKYMKYVLNDHFVLVCIFLFGGLAVYYTDTLRSLPHPFPWGKLIAGVIWFVALYIGNLATLLEPADEIFILPKEYQMKGYFQRSLGYSLLFPTVILAIVSGITMPLLRISGVEMTMFPFFLGTLVCLKVAYLAIQYFRIFLNTEKSYRLSMVIFSGLALLIIGISLWLFPWLGLLCSLFVAIVTYLFAMQQFDKQGLNWDSAIQKEKSRVHSIYRFINMFTDVPEITSSAKRRKYLDGLLKLIPATHENTFLYLYSRSFIRGQQYSGLYMRLILVAGLILYFVPQFYVSLGIAILFLYLIGFQLLPIYHQYDYMMMASLYPLPTKNKVQAVEKIVALLLGIALVIFGIVIFVALSNKIQALYSIIILTAEVFLFVKYYMPKRLEKISKN